MPSGQERALRDYLRDEVLAHCEHHRERLGPRWGRKGPRTMEDLALAPLARLAEVADPADLVLRPVLRGSAGRRGEAAREELQRRFKPVHWTIHGGVLVGNSAVDLDRMAELGMRWLGLTDVEPHDVLVNILPYGPNLGWWEVALGARRAGLSAIDLPVSPPPAQVARLRPSVLAGRPFDLARLLESAERAGTPLEDVHTLLAVGEPLDPGLRTRLAGMLGEDGSVVAAFAPPGVRALWGECRAGAGLHTWPDAEVIELVDPLSGEPVPPGADGEVVWTALGWRGTVFVRLRTGVFASMETGECPWCGSDSPRLVVTPTTPAFLAGLDRNLDVVGWQAELRRVDGDEELLVFVVPADGAGLAPLLAELDAELSATQYVVVDGDTLDARIIAAGDRRLVDLR
ncbi:MAG: phenylacetate--CoA ligase family protein [Acidimicrobiales bacterium]